LFEEVEQLQQARARGAGQSKLLRGVGERFSLLQLLRGIVGLDGFGLDEDRSVATLDVGRGGRDGAGDVARGQNSGGSDDHQGNCCPDDFHDLCFHGSRKLRLAVVSLIVLLRADIPQIGIERLVAVRVVFLRTEVLDVDGYLREVFPTRMYATRDSRETVADKDLIRCHRRRAFGLLAHKNAVAVRVCGCGDAVRAKKHLCAAVLTTLTGFC